MVKNTWHKMRVANIVKETSDAVSIYLEPTVPNVEMFKFSAGQYLVFRTKINGQELRRSYSLSSAPGDKVMRVGVKKVEGGVFSTYANEVLQIGDALEVMAPQGNFIYRPTETKKQITLVAAGSGITPVLSILKEGLEQSNDTFTLFYGNKSVDTIMYSEEIKDLKDRFMSRLQVYHVFSQEKLGSPLFKGRIDGGKCSVFFTKLAPAKKSDVFYLCGPQEMIFCVRDYLLTQGVAETCVKFELFNTTPSAKKSEKKSSSKDLGKASKVTIKMDGDQFDFLLSQDGENILDAAISEGADLPFACKGGVCSTCKAKVVKGEVSMDVNYALEPDEVKNGFILTCQAHPTTEEVVVDYDDSTFDQ